MYARILVTLDGSNESIAGADIALGLARRCGGTLVAAHVYDAGLHSRRLLEMEPFLPSRYQEEKALTHIRDTHKKLIPGGFESLSEGYMERFVEDARARGIPVEKIHRRGRNYIGILDLIGEIGADLVVVGAHGLGKVGDSWLGSTAARILRHAGCDVLLARSETKRGKILAGIDGSREALEALRKAAAWARAFEDPLVSVAVYDPHFHYQVFDAMAGALTPERQEKMGLAKQQALHEELIDKGLGNLYLDFLNQARAACREWGVESEPVILRGKAYRALVDHAGEEDASLIVLGRYGHHREKITDIGSNSEAAARLAKGNVLIVGRSQAQKSAAQDEGPAVEWEDRARRRLERIPPLARDMARQGVEAYVKSKGKDRITLRDFEEFSLRLGKGKRDHE